MGDYKLMFGKSLDKTGWYDLDLGVAQCINWIDKIPLSEEKKAIYKECFSLFWIKINNLQIVLNLS